MPSASAGAQLADDISEYRDQYRNALEELIEAEGEGEKPPQPKDEEKSTGQVVDLMTVLQQSVQASCGDIADDAHATVHDLPDASAKKKSAVKKQLAKKAGSRKTVAK